MASLSINKSNNSLWTSILKGVLMATSVTLISILLFVFAIKLFNIPSSFIMPINQVIKVVSLFFGINTMMSKNPKKGLLKGVLVGVIYTVFAYLLFSILAEGFVFNMTIINDIVFGAIIGGILGILLVNLKKSKA